MKKVITILLICILNQVSSQSTDKLLDRDKYPFVYVFKDIMIISSPNFKKEKKIAIEGQNPKWSPIGDEILYENENGLWLYNLKLNKVRKLTSSGNSPKWGVEEDIILYKLNNRYFRANISSNEQSYISMTEYDGVVPPNFPTSGLIETYYL